MVHSNVSGLEKGTINVSDTKAI